VGAKAKDAVEAAVAWGDHLRVVLVAHVYVPNVVIVSRISEACPARR